MYSWYDIGRACSSPQSFARISSLVFLTVNCWDTVRTPSLALLASGLLSRPAPRTMLRIVFVTVDRAHD